MDGQFTKVGLEKPVTFESPLFLSFPFFLSVCFCYWCYFTFNHGLYTLFS
jgi:hypothetical protein